MKSEFILLRETLDGARRKLLEMPGSMDAEELNAVADMLARMEEHEAVRFQRFDLSELRTIDQFRDKATEIGWGNFSVDIAG